MSAILIQLYRCVVTYNSSDVSLNDGCTISCTHGPVVGYSDTLDQVLPSTQDALNEKLEANESKACCYPWVKDFWHGGAVHFYELRSDQLAWFPWTIRRDVQVDISPVSGHLLQDALTSLIVSDLHFPSPPFIVLIIDIG